MIPAAALTDEVIAPTGELVRLGTLTALELRTAVPSPVRRLDIEALLASRFPRVRYMAMDALGIGTHRTWPLTPEERMAAIRRCADEIGMMRCMAEVRR